MKQGKSGIRTAAVALAVLIASAVVGVGPSDEPTGPPAGSTGLAGSRAGVGRQHPGRGQEGATPPVQWQVPEATAPATATPGPAAPHAQREAEADGGGLVFEVLPLGLGLTLMGAGLAFIGWRLRRRG